MPIYRYTPLQIEVALSATTVDFFGGIQPVEREPLIPNRRTKS